MFCPYKYDQQLQIISNIITKNDLNKGREKEKALNGKFVILFACQSTEI